VQDNTGGVPLRDIEDCYTTVEADVNEMVRVGEISRISNTESKISSLYHRNDTFMSSLSFANTPGMFVRQQYASEAPERTSDPCGYTQYHDTMSFVHTSFPDDMLLKREVERGGKSGLFCPPLTHPTPSNPTPSHRTVAHPTSSHPDLPNPITSDDFTSNTFTSNSNNRPNQKCTVTTELIPSNPDPVEDPITPDTVTSKPRHIRARHI
jgi:hypothetical protein